MNEREENSEMNWASINICMFPAKELKSNPHDESMKTDCR